jgi:hypothetical protein
MKPGLGSALPRLLRRRREIGLGLREHLVVAAAATLDTHHFLKLIIKKSRRDEVLMITP